MDIDLSDVKLTDKMGELLLYIAQRCESDPHFGAVRLAKAVWRADFISYLRTGKSITGSKYTRQPQGPVPRQLLPARRALEESGSAVVVPRLALNGRSQERLVARRDPDMSVFSPEDIQITEAVIRELEGMTAKEVSDMSHNRVWQFTPNGSDIPLASVFLSEDPPTDREIERGLELENH